MMCMIFSLLYLMKPYTISDISVSPTVLPLKEWRTSCICITWKPVRFHRNSIPARPQKLQFKNSPGDLCSFYSLRSTVLRSTKQKLSKYFETWGPGTLGDSQFCHHILLYSSFELPSLWGLRWLFAPSQSRYEPKSQGDVEVVSEGWMLMK